MAPAAWSGEAIGIENKYWRVEVAAGLMAVSVIAFTMMMGDTLWRTRAANSGNK